MLGGIQCLLCLCVVDGMTQVMGEQGEMDRLEQKAEDAIANGDAEGAALTIGKAALMAKILAHQKDNKESRFLYQTAEILFRGQEYGYRALALFEQAGGQPPASNGVCQYLSQAAKEIARSQINFQGIKNLDHSLVNRQQRYISQAEEWQLIIRDLQKDFFC